jgi:hypothetical protein
MSRGLAPLRIFLAGLALLLLAAEPAAAQPEPTPQDSERARALFDQGLRDGDQGRWEDAVRNFREALALRDAPAIRYNLGQALVELHRDAEAEPELRRVADDPAAPEDLRSRARVQLEDIEERQRASGVPTPAEAAEASEAEDGGEGEGGGIFGGDIPWLYVGIGAAAVVLTVVVIVLIAGSGGTEQVSGDLDPGVVVL